MEKIKVSSDTLYKYLLEHNFVISVLSERMGVSYGIVYNSFQHVPNRLGQPIKFSSANIKKLNDAIVQVALDMRSQILVFGSSQAYTNQQNTTYDPALLEPIKKGIGKFFKMRGMTERVLGWNIGKYNLTMSSPKSKIYGNISKDDVDRLNAELLAVAGVLSSYEVVADDELAGADNEIVPLKAEVPSFAEPIPTAEQQTNDVQPDNASCTLGDLYAAFGEDKKPVATRLRHALENHGVTTIYELLTLSPWQLLDMEGVGGVTLELVHNSLKKMGVLK